MLFCLCLLFALCKRSFGYVVFFMFTVSASVSEGLPLFGEERLFYVFFAHVGCFRFLSEVVPLFSKEYLVHIVVSMLIVLAW